MSNRRETTETRIRRMGRNADAKMAEANATNNWPLYQKGRHQQRRADKKMVAFTERKQAALKAELLRQQPDADTNITEGTTE